MFPLNPRKKQSLLSLQEIPMTSTQTIPTKVDNMTIDVQEFHSPQ
jgi:hypothetical protein